MTPADETWLGETIATRRLDRVKPNMAAAGLRPRGGEGAHRLVLDYARHQLSEVIAAHDLADADDIRRDRALAE